MNDLTVSVDIAALLTYFDDRIKALFGKDAATVDWNKRLAGRMRSAVEQANWVQCIGMERPLPIRSIYQPIKLIIPGSRGSRLRTTGVLDLIKNSIDGVIFAGPGRGKSTLLNWLSVQLLSNEAVAPFLFLLRSPGAMQDLAEFVERASGKKANRGSGRRPVLLVDGYDEIDEPERKTVSQILTDWKSTQVGNFYLTCRTFYDVYDLKVQHFRLADFTEEDATGFISAFAKGYEVTMDPAELIRDLRARDLWEFAAHPLMLALICVLKTGPLPDLPNNAIGLLKRAFDTLTFRWDQYKGIHRKSNLPLDGDERERCLMRIAFSMRTLMAGQETVESYVREHLDLKQHRNVDARRLLQELAQWFGVLVPAETEMWQFTHRSIHDYLAARFWVESNLFSPEKVRVWNTRAAYAACLSHDATPSLLCTLERQRDIQAFSECLYNKAAFNVQKVARAVVQHFEKFRRFRYSRSLTANWLAVHTDDDLFGLVTEAFLESLIAEGVAAHSEAGDVIVAYGLAELKRRNARLEYSHAYSDLSGRYGMECSFQVGFDQQPLHFKLSRVLYG